MEGQGRSRKVMDGLFPSQDWHFRWEKLWVVVGGWVACRIIVSAPVPFPFLWTLDFGLGFWTWILDLDLGLGFGTGLGLDNNPCSLTFYAINSDLWILFKSNLWVYITLFGRLLIMLINSGHSICNLIIPIKIVYHLYSIIPCQKLGELQKNKRLINQALIF